MIWLAVVICLVVSFLFSGMEAGILSVNRVRLRHRAKLREPAALTLSSLLERPERCLVSVLIVTNLMNISAVVLSTHEIVLWCGTGGYFLAGIFWLPLYLLAFELLPKSLFRRFPYRALAALTGLLRVTDFVLSPLLNAGEWSMRIAFPKARRNEKKLFIAREDFKYLTFESERQGMLGKLERKMIHNVVDVRSVKASDLMTPLEKVQTVGSDLPICAFIEMARRTAIEQMPVTSATGHITGLVNVMEVLLEAPRDGVVGKFQRRIISVGAGEPAFSVMGKLRAARLRLALVQKENGDPAGTIFWDDLIFRLVKPAGEREEKTA